MSPSELGPGEDPSLVGLNEAAEQLDVHYMTAYRYVRTGRLVATKRAGRWWVHARDLEAVRSGSSTVAVSPRPRSALVEPLVQRLVQSDFHGSWQLIEGAMASGATPVDVHEELLRPALSLIGEQWSAGDLLIAHEHRATATAQRLLGRMSPLFRPQGRRRGTVVLGAVAGDAHGLPSAMLADMLETDHLSVIDLGSNTPVDSFIDVANELDDLIGIGVVTTVGAYALKAVETAGVLKRTFPGALIVLGGSGLRDLGADDYGDAAGVVSESAAQARQAFVEASERGRTRSQVRADD